MVLARGVSLSPSEQHHADQDVEHTTPFRVRPGHGSVRAEVDEVPDPMCEPAGGDQVAGRCTARECRRAWLGRPPTASDVWYEGRVAGNAAPIVHSIEVDRSPGEVFRYVTDPEHFGGWQYDVMRVRVEDASPLEKGARFTTTRKVGRSERTMTQEIVEMDPPHRWAARGVRVRSGRTHGSWLSPSRVGAARG